MALKSRKAPELMSAAHLCEYHQAACVETLTLRINMYGANTQTIVFRQEGDQRSVTELANEWLPRMGFKTVRLTRNIMNPNSKTIVIDADTPAYLDPGREAYHSM